MTDELALTDDALDKAIVADATELQGRAEHGRRGRVAHGAPAHRPQAAAVTCREEMVWVFGVERLFDEQFAA